MPGFTVGDNYSGTSSCSAPGWDLEEFARRLARGGYVVTERNDGRPYNHRMIGTGVGHDDARWAETRWTEGSMAAYYENGEAHGGRWWERTADGFQTTGVRYYGCRPVFGRWGKRGQLHARHLFLSERGAAHADCGWCALLAAESAAESVPVAV